MDIISGLASPAPRQPVLLRVQVRGPPRGWRWLWPPGLTWGRAPTARPLVTLSFAHRVPVPTPLCALGAPSAPECARPAVLGVAWLQALGPCPGPTVSLQR